MILPIYRFVRTTAARSRFSCQLRRVIFAILALNIFTLPVYSASELEHTVEELPYGIALYDFFQDKYFSSITDILVAKENQTIVDESKTAELLLGSLYLSYGIEEKAHHIFKDITLNEAQDIPQNILDQALFQIGKNYYKGGFNELSEQALLAVGSNQQTTLGPVYESERLNILSEIYIDDHRHDEVDELLKLFPKNSVWKRYTQFNLGIDQIKNGDLDEGVLILKGIAESPPPNKELDILYDQANLALAAVYAKMEKPDLAIRYFENIKLRNPQSNIALLGLGWMKYSKNSYDDAISTWLDLSEGSKADVNVQEALMLIPYTLEKRGNQSQAISQYDFAITTYAQQLESVEKVKTSIGQGAVVNILKTSAVSENILDSHDVIQMMGPELSDYLFELLASSEFKKAVNSYRELAVLEKSLSKWDRAIPSLNLILNEKVYAYNNRLVKVIDSLKLDYAKKLQEKRAKLIAQLEKALASNSTYALVNNEEKDLLRVLVKVESTLDKVNKDDPEITELSDKYRFLAGLMKWNVDTDYAPRLWAVKTSVRELDNAIDGVNRAIQSLTSVWESAPAEHKRFREKINGKKERIESLKHEVRRLMSVQESTVQVMAEKAIEDYRVYLKHYHGRALFSKARLYDTMVLKN